MDVWELWLFVSCLSMLAVWALYELVRWVDRSSPLHHLRKQESARRDWARMIESSCYYRQDR